MNLESKKTNLMYENFNRFKHEIFLDVYDMIIRSGMSIIKKTVVELGDNEIHHIVKYHQKIALNALFFKDERLFFDYHLWLYRVYYHREIDLDFFSLLIENFQEICNKYIDSEIGINIIALYKGILDKHMYLKAEATKKRILIDSIDKATDYSRVLISANKQRAYDICKEHCPDIDHFLEFYNEVIFNAMKNIGFLWESGEISVAKEHISTNTLNDVVIRILDMYSKKEDKDKHIFISSAPHEHHSQGIHIASKVFEILGYKVTNLGVNIPTKDIKKAIIEFQPDYIILAATLQTSLIDVAHLMDDIVRDKGAFIKPIKIGIAGNAFENMLHPCRTFKADFYMKKLEDLDKYL